MRIEPLGFTRAVACASAFSEVRKQVARGCGEDDAPPLPAKMSDEQSGTSSYSTKSSIGRESGAWSESEENEVESAYNGALDMVESLEEVLPIRRGISKFYNGKSKSFTSLVDASCSASVKDIAKAENAYTRRRRNLMAFNHVWDKNRNFPLRRSNSGGISKRTISSSRRRSASGIYH